MDNETKSVIIYRSKTEQMQDEMVMKFIEEHPNAVIYSTCIFLGIFVTIFGKVIWNFFQIGRMLRKVK